MSIRRSTGDSGIINFIYHVVVTNSFFLLIATTAVVSAFMVVEKLVLHTSARKIFIRQSPASFDREDSFVTKNGAEESSYRGHRFILRISNSIASSVTGVQQHGSQFLPFVPVLQTSSVCA